MASWKFLIVGSFAAIGAAMALGTVAALVRYYRTGRFPQQDTDDATPPSRGQLVGLWVRVLVGVAVAVYGVVSLAKAGLLGG